MIACTLYFVGFFIAVLMFLGYNKQTRWSTRLTLTQLEAHLFREYADVSVVAPLTLLVALSYNGGYFLKHPDNFYKLIGKFIKWNFV